MIIFDCLMFLAPRFAIKYIDFKAFCNLFIPFTVLIPIKHVNMTNAEIKLVVKALCLALGDPERGYTVYVTDNKIEIEYLVTVIVDTEIDPSLQRETEYVITANQLPHMDELDKIVAAVKEEIEEIESVGIGYEHFKK